MTSKVGKMFGVNKSNQTFSTPDRQSAGILDDFAVRKVMNSIEGTIEQVPVNDNDIVNKAYADSVGGGSFEGTMDDIDDGETYVKTHNDYTDAEKTVVGNTSNTNTGDQSSSDFDHDSLTNTHNLTTDIDHDALTNFEANEHIDWTTDQGATNIHAGNYTNTTYSASDFNHNDLSNIDAGDINHLTDAQVSALHTQNSDTSLDSGGANEVSAAQAKTAYTHSQDNTQAHSDYLLNSEADTGVGLVLTGDNSSADTQYTAQVLYNTDETPPAASGFPVGTIYIQYTA